MSFWDYLQLHESASKWFWTLINAFALIVIYCLASLGDWLNDDRKRNRR